MFSRKWPWYIVLQSIDDNAFSMLSWVMNESCKNNELISWGDIETMGRVWNPSLVFVVWVNICNVLKIGTNDHLLHNHTFRATNGGENTTSNQWGESIAFSLRLTDRELLGEDGINDYASPSSWGKNLCEMRVNDRFTNKWIEEMWDASVFVMCILRMEWMGVVLYTSRFIKWKVFTWSATNPLKCAVSTLERE